MKERGAFARAEAALVKTLDLAPGDPRARCALAEMKLEQGRPSEAIAVMEAAPDSRKLMRELALAWMQLLIDAGDYEAAIARLQARRLEASDPRFMFRLEAIQARLAADRAAGVPPEARRSYVKGLEKLVRRDPAGAEPLLEAVTRDAPAFAPAWAALKGARALLGLAEPTGAPGSAEPLLARRLGGRGLVFDPADRFEIRARAERLTEVFTPDELGRTPNAWISLDPGGEAREARPTIALGGPGDDYRAPYRTSETFMACLENVAVVGRGVVITSQGELIEELIGGASPHKFEADREGQTLSFYPRTFRDGLCPVKVVDEPAMLMAGPTDSAFGDWMVNFMPRIPAARRAGFDLPIVVRADAPAFVRKMLAFVGLDPQRFVEHDRTGVTVFRQLYVPSWPMPRRGTHMAGHLQGLAIRPAAATAEGPRRIYLSRETMTARPLVNEAEVRARFEALGFVSIRPEALSLEALHALLSGASHVAGGYGSAWLNLAFCERRPVSLVCMPDYYDGFFREVSLWMGAMEAPFGLLLGENDGKGDYRQLMDGPWSIDLERLDIAIDRFLAWEGQAS